MKAVKRNFPLEKAPAAWCVSAGNVSKVLLQDTSHRYANRQAWLSNGDSDMAHLQPAL